MTILMCTAYWNTVLRDPGRPQENMAARDEGKDIPQCDKCKLPKPERAHHCSVCGRCTLKMDHHCPW
eukprot:CAMPEP_0167747166 /NCGR_PEP_ID=MMETSP0110_2-20121227/4131_1 /TAXON_ID=629695 /ORGANISM="Gymnochlora sp., Strain CCMP2014" /LENGTH=66 /DNA_ID=CAMNT_0007632039 /DNA_START=193 /DNA_END=390 /DNA_ORIENTATION=-